MQPTGKIKTHHPEQAAVLIVDDDENVCKMLKVALLAEGYRVDSATSAKDAFSLLPSLRPRVAVIDIKLPGIDGLDICREFVTQYGIEAILITGDDEQYSYEDAAQAGASDFLVKPIRVREFVLRVERAVSAHKTRIERDETVSKLKRLSETDGLTGLYNSRHFAKRLLAEIYRAENAGYPLSLLLLDLDHFKRVNDEHGHLKGDSVLLRIGEVIREVVRGSDSAYRYGGEEFAVILPETDEEAAIRVAERLRAAIASECASGTDGCAVGVTASVGIAVRKPKEAAEAFLHRADMAMYEAKRKGRNRTETASEPAEDQQESEA
jgi:diguanylate cyclase (GGDEF)-like protein